MYSGTPIFKGSMTQSLTAKKITRLSQTIKAIDINSGKVSGWTLSIIGGSLLAILSDSYIHPTYRELRLLYLLFVPAWALLATSLAHGINVSGNAIASDLYSNNLELTTSIFDQSERSFSKQLKAFRAGLVFLAIWLVLYLVWWIFGYAPIQKNLFDLL
jgi:hypothetical protein